MFGAFLSESPKSSWQRKQVDSMWSLSILKRGG
jgi:hypothetical protein